jgi:hypothetical protein
VKKTKRRYPVPKKHELSEETKEKIRARIRRGDDNVYSVGAYYACSPSQVAGLKAGITRSGG